MNEQINNTLEALRRNNMEAYYVDTKEEAREKALSFINKQDTVAVGGSVTLNQLGMLDILRNGNYVFLDRYSVSDPAQIQRIFHESLSADVFLCSSNAITENGELYNVDGTCNRISAITYGPKSVVIIAGVNKLVKDLDEAVMRVKAVAAPLNCKRLNKNTYCAAKGKCASIDAGKGAQMTAGCSSPQRICRSYSVCGPQSVKDRIKIILVGENLGY